MTKRKNEVNVSDFVKLSEQIKALEAENESLKKRVTTLEKKTEQMRRKLLPLRMK